MVRVWYFVLYKEWDVMFYFLLYDESVELFIKKKKCIGGGLCVEIIGIVGVGVIRVVKI